MFAFYSFSYFQFRRKNTLNLSTMRMEIKNVLCGGFSMLLNHCPALPTTPGSLAQWRATYICHEPLNLLFCITFQRGAPAIVPNCLLLAVPAFPRAFPTTVFFLSNP